MSNFIRKSISFRIGQIKAPTFDTACVWELRPQHCTRDYATLKLLLEDHLFTPLYYEDSRRWHQHHLLKTPFSRVINGQNKKKLTKLQWMIQIRNYADLPEHTKVNLPALSPTMEKGSIVSWAKKEGDKLSEGDLMCEIETDKATMGFETPEEGYLAKIVLPAGTKDIPVGKLLCIIVSEQADVAAFKDFKDAGGEGKLKKSIAPAVAAAPAKAPAAAPVPKQAAAPAPARAPATTAPSGGRVYASPMARKLSELKNIRLGGKGSGLYGSLKSTDLLGAGAAAPASSPPPAAAPRASSSSPGASFVDIPLSSMRATIAERLTVSKQTVPHYQLTATVNIEKTIAMRKRINDKLKAEKSDLKISLNDFIVKAVASACKRVPDVNAHWMDTFIRQYANVDVSVAVATPTGLLTPILFNADSRGIFELSRNMKKLSAKAREGKLQPNEFQGGTVTVSNLGMFGITMFNAIINPPQSLILACGGIQEMVIAVSSGKKDKEKKTFKTARFATFTASANHKVVDGAVAALWMKALKENLEDPANMIL